MKHRSILFVLALLAALLPAGARAAAPEEDASQLEALVETSKGNITIRFFPKEAPKHVASFVDTARKGGYDATTFFRVVPYAIVQGGDPLSKNPAKKALYGTGGLKLLPDEVSGLKHLVGAVSAVMIPGPGGAPQPGSSGLQFFICDTPQPALDGKYTVFGRVVEGMDVVRAISTLPATKDQKLVERVEIKRVTIRPVTPTVEEMKRLQAHIETASGEFVLEFLPDVAPENARNFIRLARSGIYDGAPIYRAIKDLLIQGAAPLKGWPADHPNSKRSFSIWPVVAEPSLGVPFDRGIVGLAHGEDPNGGTIHWFVLLSRHAALDGKFTPFAKVVSGIEVVEAISRQPVTGDRLDAPVVITRVWIGEK